MCTEGHLHQLHDYAGSSTIHTSASKNLRVRQDRAQKALGQPHLRRLRHVGIRNHPIGSCQRTMSESTATRFGAVAAT